MHIRHSAVLLTLLFLSCGLFSSNIAVSGVTLNKASTSLSIGATETLLATIIPYNATDRRVGWSTSDSTVATVSSLGVVTGVSGGSSTITVTTVDGSKTATCAVTVTASSAKEMTSFGFISPSVTGTIVGTNIAVSVLTGTNVTALVARFTVSAGASVKVGSVTQVSGTTANDFTSPVIYTVIAADGSTKAYTVTVSFGSSSAKDIITYGIVSPQVEGTINGTDILMSVPVGTNVTALVAVFTVSDGASVTVGSVAQVSGTTANDFTNPVIYTVTANDGSTKTYTVIVPTPGFEALPAEGTWTTGHLNTSGGAVWFEATVTGGQSYILNWDDQYEGSGSYTLDVVVSAYEQDQATSYFLTQDSGYSTARIIDVPAGQTRLYVKVTAYFSGPTGSFALKLAIKPPGGTIIVTID